MDWWLIIFIGILVLALIFIFITLATLPELGDERKAFIKMKAQSFTFNVVIIWILVEVLQSIYLNLSTDNTVTGINPFIFLTVISVVYLIALLFVKKKYGG